MKRKNPPDGTVSHLPRSSSDTASHFPDHDPRLDLKVFESTLLKLFGGNTEFGTGEVHDGTRASEIPLSDQFALNCLRSIASQLELTYLYVNTEDHKPLVVENQLYQLAGTVSAMESLLFSLVRHRQASEQQEAAE